MDVLVTNLSRKASIYKKLANELDCLTDLNLLADERDKQAMVLIKAYPSDIDDSLLSQLVHFHAYVRSGQNTTVPASAVSHQDLYTMISHDGLQSAFSIVEVILRLFLSLMVTNCSGEKSFSQLKCIKNDLRSTMSQTRLQSLSLLCMGVISYMSVTLLSVILLCENRERTYLCNNLML